MGAEQHIRTLQTQRKRVWEQSKEFLEGIHRQRRNMTATEEQTWNRYNEHLDRIDSEIRGTADRERAELDSAREYEGLFGAGGGRSAHGDQVAREADLIRRFAKGDPTVGEADPENMSKRVLRIPVARAMEERQLLNEGYSPKEARAIAWDTGSIASAVPTLMARTIWQYFEASVALWRMPTTKVPTETGAQMKLPRLAAHSIATQVSGQGTLLAGTDPTFAALTLDAYKYGELVKVADEALTDVAFDLVNFLSRDLARAIGRKVAVDFAVGSGTGKPMGLMTALASCGSVVTGGTNLTSLTFESLIDTVYGINDEYRNLPSTAWLMRDATAAKVRRIRDGAGGTTGAFIWDSSTTGGMVHGQQGFLLGYPVFTDPSVASLASDARIAAFGAMEGFYIRHVGDVLIERSDERYFDTDEVGFRAKWRVDSDLMDTLAITSLNNSVV